VHCDFDGRDYPAPAEHADLGLFDSARACLLNAVLTSWPMNRTAYTREALPRGAVKLASTDGHFLFSRPRPGVLLIEVAGHDSGQYGTSVLDEITNGLRRERPLELFVDTRDAVSVSTQVREDWTRFFASNRQNLSAVHILTRSKFVHIAIAVAQLFSKTGNLIRLYSKPESFQMQLDRACSERPLPRTQ
jgi:hypothetical protein